MQTLDGITRSRKIRETKGERGKLGARGSQVYAQTVNVMIVAKKRGYRSFVEFLAVCFIGR